jgi:hypothetical protein
MLQIHTFSGEGDKLDEAIAEAEVDAAEFLKDITHDQILSVQAQTITTTWKTDTTTSMSTTMHILYSHVITVVSS